MKLNKLISLTSAATLALFAANPAFADDHAEAPVEATTEATTETKGPALWKVADEDTTIYMFGTVHMLPDTVDWNSGAVNEALASSETLVTELDLTPETEAAVGLAFQQRGMLPQGQTLRSLMTEEQLKTYEAGMAKIQVPAEAFDQLEPWFASFALLQIVTTASGFTPEKGVETVLEKAIKPGTKRVALETVEQQIDVFDNLSIDKQMTYFIEFAADPIEGIQGLNLIIDAWAKGDAEGVGEMITEAVEGQPEMAERLFYARNKNWAEWIDTRLDSPGTVFMAVGAGHLAGEKSVQDYLAERGIQTTREQ